MQTGKSFLVLFFKKEHTFLLPVAGALWLAWQHGWRQGTAWVLGVALGYVMFQASFSFAGAFRRLMAARRGAGVRAQLLMIAVAALLILPATTHGTVLGQDVRGLVFAPGLAVVVGAFLFGVGMQLGGGCASGCLFGAGGGSARLALTLVFFVLGATLASWQSEWWTGWWAPAPVALGGVLGAWPALALTLAVLGAAFGAVWWVERARHGTAAPLPRLVVWAALALAGLNFATLLVLGRPWAITAAFPLWGAKAVEALGLDEPAFWPWWEDPTRIEALLRPLSADRTTAMDLGMLAGAFLAAVLAGRFVRSWRLPAGEAAASVVGGLLLGVGAMLGAGCNISAYVSGIASGSLHGWLWIVPALLGNRLGLALRPAFGIRDA
jgi:uncharacterized membrane protein YedE/YeeE